MTKDDLLLIGKEVLKPTDSGDIVEWCENNVLAIPDSPMPGSFKADRTPWVAEALRIAADPETKLLTTLASIQSGKTLFARLFTCYVIANHPAPMMFLQKTDLEAKDFALRYLRPVWNNCPPVKKRLRNDDMERSTTIDFDRMTVYCRGIFNEANLQRLSLRYLIIDEAWQAPQGHLAEASARVTAFGYLGKRIIMSQGGSEGQEFHQLHSTTDIKDWCFRCPQCDHLQPWIWEQVKFPQDAKVNGDWDLLKVQKQTTYECEQCKTLLPDNPGTRLEANKRGSFVSKVSNKPTGAIGLQWNALATMSWGELAVERIKAKSYLKDYGDREPIKIFIQKRLAQEFKEEADEINLATAAGGYFLETEWEEEGGFVKGRPVPGSLLSPEMKLAPDFVRMRFMTVDVQRRGFYWIVRSWNGEGASRLVQCGYCFAWGEVIDLHKKFEVHPANVFVDSGDQQDEVLNACAVNGWHATRGDQRNEFTWKVRTPVGMKSEHRPYSPPVVENIGTKRTKRTYFSNLRFKDQLALLIRQGKHTRADNVPDEYVQQMQSERRTVSQSGRAIWEQIASRDNHFWDCEVMQMLPALGWRLIAPRKPSEAQDPDEAPEPQV